MAADTGEWCPAAGRWTFLFGFWGAVFSSLLGVWQSVPYLFADFVSLPRGETPGLFPVARTCGSVVVERSQESGTARTGVMTDLRGTKSYRVYLLALAVVPLPVLWVDLKTAQLLYAFFGALFMPLLALTLLLMNNRAGWVGRRFCNGWLTNAVLVATLLFFAFTAALTVREKLAAVVAAG